MEKCAVFFEGHMVSSQPMKVKKNLQQMVTTINCASENIFRQVPSSFNLYERIVNFDYFIYST